MHYITGIFTSYSLEQSSILWTLIILGDEAIYYIKWIQYLLDVITMMLTLLHGTLLLDLLHIQAMSTGQFLRQMSPSPVFVNIQGYATLQSTYLIMLVQFV